MTKFRFAVYGIVHAGDEIEAKAALQDAIKESPLPSIEKYDVLVEEIISE
jgi:hypothetical protein